MIDYPRCIKTRTVNAAVKTIHNWVRKFHYGNELLRRTSLKLYRKVK